ncbi:MAG: bifunctional glutamate N-acetyltransferase/amino-acid acetyltransferase ArgJ [Candidatus Omnitrophica bacterium]|nr:bifunctional glutamate N-acetyltransferase/amino-acid acetyltransferase ArgJ [Candidatus Omnitrophota bacterium]
MIEGGVTAPLGFKANGAACGIKRSKKRDLSLIVSERRCDAAGVFTTNKVQAPCVIINKERLKDQKAQAIIANSGNANCMTGKSGFKNSELMARTAARSLKIKADDVLTASTGVIGKPLPIKKIMAALPALVKGLSRKGHEPAAHGILTTDRVIKETAAEFHVAGKKVRIGAMAKGAGMIHPQMELPPLKHATMLCFITTDAVIASTALRDALKQAVDKTFNLMTIDGDMSTNDMALILASGLAQNKRIVEKTKEFRAFCGVLEALCLALAKEMVKDAEGATKFVEILVRRAETREDARRVARTVAGSNLVKCALFGSDPNWGRIAAAVGYAPARVDPWKLHLYLGKELVLRNGGRVKKKAVILNRIFAHKNIKITVDLGLGRYGATAYTCDLSTNYVRINSAYRT